MKQALHIALKDLRHIWPETVISLLLTITFAIIYPIQWHANGAVFARTYSSPAQAVVMPQELQLITFLLHVLIPVSWYLLIGRIVYDESLVGDRQFWLTRPYQWTSLAGAKFLFLAALLYLPTLIMQCWLLWQAGFAPFAYLPGLLYNLLLISGILVLPLFAIATVTPSFSRMALTLIAGLLCFIAVSALSSGVAIQVNNDAEDRVSLPLVLFVCAGVVLLQYATRRVWLARTILAVLALTLAGISAFVSSGALMDHTYPRDAAAPPVHLTFNATGSHAPSAFRNAYRKGIPYFLVTLPLDISGIAPGHAWVADDVTLTLDGPRGSWQSKWQSFGARLLPDETVLHVPFFISKPDLDRFQASPVTIHLTVAYTSLEGGQPVTIAMPDHDFSVPGFGICSPRATALPVVYTGIECRSPLRNPRLTYAETRWSVGACPAPSEPAAQDGVLGSGWTGDISDRPAQFGITSVRENPLNLSNRSRDQGPEDPRKSPRHLCPGTPITFTQYHVQHRGQFTLTLPNFPMPTETNAVAGGNFTAFEVR